MAVQTTTNTYPGVGLPGEISRPNEPIRIERLPVYVPASGRKPRPGDAVYWNGTNDAVAAPTSAAQQLLAIGIVHFEQNRVQGKLTAVPSGADTDTFIQYEDGELAPIVMMGTVYVRAGGACEFHDLMRWQHGDHKWNADSPAHPPTLAELYQRPIECVSRSGADEDLIEVNVGGGRVY